MQKRIDKKVKSKEKLKSEVKNYITFMFERSLDYCQVACSNDRYKALRGKILREGNNCIRTLHKVIDRDYDVNYIVNNEDFIEIKKQIGLGVQDMVENEKDMVEVLREFEGPDGNKFKIVAPTAADIRGADWTYSKIYTKSLVAEVTTEAEMRDILIRRDIIGPDFEKRSEELSLNLQDLILKMNSEENMNKKEELAQAVAETRQELFNWNQRLNGPMSNTCEQLADDARLEYLTSCMVVDSNNEKVWDSYENYLLEKNNSMSVRARYNVMLYLQGLDEDFLDNVPEAIAVREIEQKRAEDTIKNASVEKEIKSKEGAVKKSKKK